MALTGRASSGVGYPLNLPMVHIDPELVTGGGHLFQLGRNAAPVSATVIPIFEKNHKSVCCCCRGGKDRKTMVKGPKSSTALCPSICREWPPAPVRPTSPHPQFIL